MTVNVDATPMSFYEMTAEALTNRAKILQTYWGIRSATFDDKYLTGSGQVTEL